jgi:hypothetical protein
MKQLVQVIVVVIAIGTLAVVTTQDLTAGKVTQDSVPAQQPPREPYRAPVWVTNDKGQRCIQQGRTVTCG